MRAGAGLCGLVLPVSTLLRAPLRSRAVRRAAGLAVASTMIVVALSRLRATNIMSHPRAVTTGGGGGLPTHEVTLQPPQRDFVDAARQTVDEHGVTIVLSASYGYLPLLLNSACSMKRVGIKRALLVALDRRVFDWAAESDFYVPVMLPDVRNRSTDRPELIKYGSPGFAAVTMQKFTCVERVLATGTSVLFADGDIFWCNRSPVPEVVAAAASSGADILFQTSWESPRPPAGDFINSGLFFARPTTRVRELFLRIAMDHKFRPVGHDQRAVNNRLCEESLGGHVVYETGGPLGMWRGRPSYCTRDGLRAAFLSRVRFPNGRRVTRNILSEARRSTLRARCDRGDYAMLHNNWEEGRRKEMRFRAKGLWYASPDNRTCLTSPAPKPTSQECGSYCDQWSKDTSD
jgi:hypothetical protein